METYTRFFFFCSCATHVMIITMLSPLSPSAIIDSNASASDGSQVVVMSISIVVICLVLLLWLSLHFLWRQRDIKKIDSAIELEAQKLLNAKSVSTCYDKIVHAFTIYIYTLLYMSILLISYLFTYSIKLYACHFLFAFP